MATSTRLRILDAALELLRAEGGGAVTLDATARQVGLTKPGLMYHFPTKEALMLAVVDHVADRWEAQLESALDVPLTGASPQQRIRAYVDVCLAGEFDRADFAIYTDAQYFTAFTAAWVDRLEPWIALPADLPPDVRARLDAARLMADGYWTAAATDVFPVSPADRARLLAIAEDLITADEPT
jgi:AcrR family transcriptional regulator